MKAIRIHEYGDAGTLRLEKVPPLSISEDQMPVRVQCQMAFAGSKDTGVDVTVRRLCDPAGDCLTSSGTFAVS